MDMVGKEPTGRASRGPGHPRARVQLHGGNGVLGSLESVQTITDPVRGGLHGPPDRVPAFLYKATDSSVGNTSRQSGILVLFEPQIHAWRCIMPETDVLQGLNPKQAEAVKHTDGPLSFWREPARKTTVLTRRVAYHIERGSPRFNPRHHFHQQSGKRFKDPYRGSHG